MLLYQISKHGVVASELGDEQMIEIIKKEIEMIDPTEKSRQPEEVIDRNMNVKDSASEGSKGSEQQSRQRNRGCIILENTHESSS